jgi:hypothetical protein
MVFSWEALWQFTFHLKMQKGALKTQFHKWLVRIDPFVVCKRDSHDSELKLILNPICIHVSLFGIELRYEFGHSCDSSDSGVLYFCS